MVVDAAAERLSDGSRQYGLADLIGGVRRAVDAWRSLPEEQWRVTPEAARLLRRWRRRRFAGLRPFFRQTEAAETAIWLAEAAPRAAAGKRILDRLEAASPAMGEADESRPVVVARGVPYPRREGGAAELLRPAERGLFR